MNTVQINSRMKNVPNFIGVFPINRLPHVRQTTFSFIFNTDPSHEPGTHWIAVYVTPERAEYFDSTGERPLITDYLRRLQRAVYYNNHMIQAKESIACGAFACDFIKRRCRGETFCEILDSYSRNRLFNDFMINSW